MRNETASNKCLDQKTASNSNEYPEIDAEIRVVIKIKQNSAGIVKGYVRNLEVKTTKVLYRNTNQLISEYEFQYDTDSTIKVMIGYILTNRAL